jgi:hypothetical protein
MNKECFICGNDKKMETIDLGYTKFDKLIEVLPHIIIWDDDDHWHIANDAEMMSETEKVEEIYLCDNCYEDKLWEEHKGGKNGTKI